MRCNLVEGHWKTESFIRLFTAKSACDILYITIQLSNMIIQLIEADILFALDLFPCPSWDDLLVVFSLLLGKSKFERNLAKDWNKNSKAYYSYVKSKTKNKVSIGPIVHNEEVVADSETMASILNNW